MLKLNKVAMAVMVTTVSAVIELLQNEVVF